MRTRGHMSFSARQPTRTRPAQLAAITLANVQAATRPQEWGR